MILEPKILIASIILSALVMLALTGCSTLELRQKIGSRGEYGEVFAGYRFPNLDDPTESPAWLYPDFQQKKNVK